MDKQTFPPVTFGYLRREAKWLHLYCTVCGHEREFEVPTLGQLMVCSKCGTKGKVWSVPEINGASAETVER